jgi:hypothetical protein
MVKCKKMGRGGKSISTVNCTRYRAKQSQSAENSKPPTCGSYHSNLDELLASSDKRQNFGAVDSKGKMNPCTGTEALYGPYGPYGG